MENLSELLAKLERPQKPEKPIEAESDTLATTSSDAVALQGEYIQKSLEGIDDTILKANPNNVVTQANVLVSASYQLSLNAKRVLLLALSQIDSTRADIFQNDYKMRIKAKEFHEYFGGRLSSAYTEYKKGIRDLSKSQVIEIDDEQRDKGFNWLVDWDIQKNLGYADIVLNKRLMPYVSNLSSAFTSYKLINVGGLRSTYSIRLYELAMKYERKHEKIGKFNIDVMDLRFLFALPDGKCERFSHFNSAILSRAVKDINEKTNIRLFVEPVKVGRTVLSLNIHFGKDVDILPIEEATKSRTTRKT